MQEVQFHQTSQSQGQISKIRRVCSLSNMATTSLKRDLTQVFKQMSLLDKLLPILIVLAIVIGIIISVYAPHAQSIFNNTDNNKLTSVSVPLTIGLVVMMIPPLCKIEYEQVYTFATGINNNNSNN